MELILILILGLCYGSFINVLIYRLPNSISIISPRSFCPDCKSTIPSYRNIPLISYILQLGRCHNCKKNISIQYPTIEIITALSWIYIYISSENLSNIIFSIIMISFLIPLAIIDLKHMFFPISLVLPLIVISSTFATIQYYHFKSLESLYGMIVPLIFFGFVYFAVWAWFNYKNIKKQPMGFGDILLIIPLGAWLGPLAILVSIFIASLIALLTWIILNRFNLLKLDKKMPFGPYLIISAIITKFLNIIHLIDATFQII